MKVSVTSGKYALEYNEEGLIVSASPYCPSGKCLYVSGVSLETPQQIKQFKRTYWINPRTLKLQKRWNAVKLLEEANGDYTLINFGDTSEEMSLCILRKDDREGGCCIRRSYRAGGRQTGVLRKSTLQRHCSDNFVIARISGDSQGILDIPLWI